MPRSAVKLEEPLLIRVNLAVNGSIYELDPLSKRRIEKEFPEAQGLPSVFFGYASKDEFESRHGRLWELAGTLLTGLTLEQIGQLGGMRIYYPREKKVIWEWKPSNGE
jgi:hypothetical protein